ncbi:MAG: type II toxin-antitoxin system mRNA interferase toxin, RelE/StbE family [Deltaproteobacteria bacterium]|nr:type II toxin-antitoxin system mRNA interferase toxin, RelE/StbE family [Deltaproteobacteria bacterium]
MYTVLEHKEVAKVFKRAPVEIKRSYLAWKRIVELEGPQGLRLMKGFHDEALRGEWGGFRSSRLNRQWRVIYKIDKDQLTVYVVEINPHSY